MTPYQVNALLEEHREVMARQQRVIEQAQGQGAGGAVR